MADTDWVDTYNGDIDNIGINPYSLSATQPGGQAAQGNSPLSGLAAALGKYGGSSQGYADPMSQQPFPANQVQPGYTDPLSLVPDYANPQG